MKKKLKLVIPLVVLLLAAGAAYKLVLAPSHAKADQKISGTLVPLGEQFIVNLADGHYGQVSVSLLVDGPGPGKPAADGTPAKLDQNDAIRAIVTDDLTGLSATDLTNRGSRHRLLARLLEDLKRGTDEPITKVLFTDLAVQ